MKNPLPKSQYMLKKLWAFIHTVKDEKLFNSEESSYKYNEFLFYS